MTASAAIRSTRSSPEPGEEEEVTTTTVVTRVTGGREQSHRLAPITTEISHVGAVDVEHEVGPDGTLHLHPRSPAGQHRPRVKIKRVVTFEARVSQFDRDNAAAAKDVFRGFYTLFWILLFMIGVRTFEKSYEDSGFVIGTRFATLFSEDAKVLALSDLVLVSSTLLCVPFMKLVVGGYLRYYWAGAILQHIVQTAFLGLAVRWTFFRAWPWVQSGFLTLHACTMLMKIHSYCATNGELSSKDRQVQRLRKDLDTELGKEGGKKQVLQQIKRKSIEVTDVADSTALEGREETAAPRRRSSHRGPTRPPLDPEVDILTESPNKKIADLANRIADLEDELTSTGPRGVRWPANVTLLNFLDYLVIPTLVYELEYPRTRTIRPLYVLEKVAATFGTFSLLYILTEHYILPVTERTDQSFLTNMLDLAAPFMACYCLLFFIIFECICNAFAELSMFADRQFYEDWWNSVSFDQFSRRWNKPVHTFLLRHVYASTISSWGISKMSAAFVTFFLSACMHELVMAVVTKKIRMFLFTMQMAQLPLVIAGRAKVFKRHPALGNLIFWLGLMSGFPLLGVAYIRS